MPGSVPPTWLIVTPPMPLATTTMLCAMSSGRACNEGERDGLAPGDRLGFFIPRTKTCLRGPRFQCGFEFPRGFAALVLQAQPEGVEWNTDRGSQ